MPAAYEQCPSVGGLNSVSGPGPASAPASWPSVPHIPWVSNHDRASIGLAHFGTQGLPRPCPQYCSVPFRLLRASSSQPRPFPAPRPLIVLCPLPGMPRLIPLTIRLALCGPQSRGSLWSFTDLVQRLLLGWPAVRLWEGDFSLSLSFLSCKMELF